MPKVSIIIPSRNEPYLNKTVDDIFTKATGDIEVIVMADGGWPDPFPADRKGLTVVHRGDVCGSRANENAGARIANGDFIMKLDAHCMVGPGFDEILARDCKEENWMLIPSRYSLDVDKWEPRTDRRPVEYLFLTFPYARDEIYGTGFHGKKWRGPHGNDGSYWYMEKKRKKKKLDDIIIFQGSSWFVHKSYFFDGIGGLDDKNYYFTQEAVELSMKMWLSGGRVLRDKNTWYAHFHKDKVHGGRYFSLSKRLSVATKVYSTDYWMNDRWPLAKRPLKWLIDKFGPMSGWPEDWQNPKYAEGFDGK